VKLTFIESRNFTERICVLTNDETYRAFQNELQDHPQRGDLIQGTGGLRKARMRLPGRGKRGSARVIYLYLENHAVIYLLTLYTKKEQADLEPGQRKALRAIAEEIKRAWRDRL
jgi:hypothetical protein